MATEAEVIQKIRYQVDNYDELQELSQSSKLSEMGTSNLHPQTQLCSPEANQITLSAYNITLHQQHRITDFLDSLSTFLEKSNKPPDTDLYEVSVWDWLIFSFYTDETDNPLPFMLSDI